MQYLKYVKHINFDTICKSFNWNCYRFAEGREMKTRDREQANCIKDEEDKVLVTKQEIKE